VLVDSYSWFTEGFDLPDLQDAHALLWGYKSGRLEEPELAGCFSFLDMLPLIILSWKMHGSYSLGLNHL
jgi:hypothetical protein